MVVDSNPVAVTEASDMTPALSKEFLDILTSAECRFNLYVANDMIITYSQMQRTQISTHSTAQSFGQFG